MFDVDEKQSAKLPQAQRLNPDKQIPVDREVIDRHTRLMECMTDEAEVQADERMQMAIDEDYYDHLQWRAEDAAVLMERGQAPLVFNDVDASRKMTTL